MAGGVSSRVGTTIVFDSSDHPDSRYGGVEETIVLVAQGKFAEADAMTVHSSTTWATFLLSLRTGLQHYE